jgi:hypothetical protein
MKIKFVAVTILLVAAVLIAGCITGKDVGSTALPGSEILQKMNLPGGFTYLGIHEIQMKIGGNSLNATEGVYKYNGDDIYIQIIKNNNPAALLDQYKEDLKNDIDTAENPFQQINFNGHTATQAKGYAVIKGKTEPRYIAIWANDKYMFIVGRSSDTATVVTLATATGS